MKAFKAFIKPSETPQRSVKINIQFIFQNNFPKCTGREGLTGVRNKVAAWKSSSTLKFPNFHANGLTSQKQRTCIQNDWLNSPLFVCSN